MADSFLHLQIQEQLDQAKRDTQKALKLYNNLKKVHTDAEIKIAELEIQVETLNIIVEQQAQKIQDLDQDLPKPN